MYKTIIFVFFFYLLAYTCIQGLKLTVPYRYCNMIFEFGSRYIRLLSL